MTLKKTKVGKFIYRIEDYSIGLMTFYKIERRGVGLAWLSGWEVYSVHTDKDEAFDRFDAVVFAREGIAI